MSARPLEQIRSAAKPQNVAAMLLLMCGIYAVIFPFYAGNATILAMFVASGTLLICCAIALHPSFFVVLLALFLTLGFLFKAVAYFTFGAQLTEPIGHFSGSAAQWDMALGFATAGQSGAIAAIILASFIPSHGGLILKPSKDQRTLGNILLATLALLLVLSTCVYALNYRYTILRIGYPIGIGIDPRIYSLLAFILSWGALLGGLALTQWLIELKRLRDACLILVAGYLGFLASLTMGSRIQFLLYVLAAVCVILWRWRAVQGWIAIVLALGLSGILFVLSIAVVSIERNYAFVGGPSPSSPAFDRPPADSGSDLPQDSVRPSKTQMLPPGETENFATKFDTVTSESRLDGMLRELRSLFLMRWVGLEGTMTTASAEPELSRNLLLRGLSENPALGTNGIYQKMAGDPYDHVKVFTFLTLPGLIGFASFSGSFLLISVFVFGAMLTGHLVEWLGWRMTGNVAVAAVCGVSLAYLTVQIGFPWTLFIYVNELGLACAALGLFWLAGRQLITSRV